MEAPDRRPKAEEDERSSWRGGAPSALDELTSLVAGDAELDAAYCEWARVAPDGEFVTTHHWDRPSELFSGFTRTCCFQIHTCLVRRSLVQAVGAFDVSLDTCEDWDLWQRIARTGARFAMVPKVLAFYRLRQNAASLDPWRLLRDGLRVIDRGHSSDPRVRRPDPAYARGAPADQRSRARLLYSCWPGGLLIGRGEDARPLLRLLGADMDPGLDPPEVAELLFGAVPLTGGTRPADWSTLWSVVGDRLDDFLSALERKAGADGLARRVRESLERLTAAHGESAQTPTVVRPLW